MSRRTSSRAAILCAAFALALTGCGGGGGAAPPPPDIDFDAQAAWDNFLAGAPGTGWVVSGRGSDGLFYDMELLVTPVIGGRFPVTDTPAHRADVESVIYVNGVVEAIGTSELYYDDWLQLYGSRDTFDIVGEPPTTTCDEAMDWDIPPANARLGDSGLLASTDVLNGCSPSSPLLGNATIRWSLEWIHGLAFFCITFDERSNDGLSTLEKNCFETDPAGNLGTRAFVALRSPGFALDMTTP